MDKYNYREAVKADIAEWLKNEYEEGYIDETEQDRIYDTLWVADSVTGNASGSYYCSIWKAENALCHNLDLLGEAMRNFGCEAFDVGKGAEWADVTIRCYLLGKCLAEAVEEWNFNHPEEGK